MNPYFQCIRFRYHITFISVFLGALLFRSEPLSVVVFDLVLLYASFNVLLYGGLYTLNDIADIASDSLHPTKSTRPIASGSVPRAHAWSFAVAMIVLGVLSAHVLFGSAVSAMYLLFVASNVFYSFIAKRVPYIEFLVNAVTHPMRFALGILLVDAFPPYWLLTAIFLLAFQIAVKRRLMELAAHGVQGRPTLKHYSVSTLQALQMIALLFMLLSIAQDQSVSAAWHALLVLLSLLTILGSSVSHSCKRAWEWLLLH